MTVGKHILEFSTMATESMHQAIADSKDPISSNLAYNPSYPRSRVLGLNSNQPEESGATNNILKRKFKKDFRRKIKRQVHQFDRSKLVA